VVSPVQPRRMAPRRQGPERVSPFRGMVPGGLPSRASAPPDAVCSVPSSRTRSAMLDVSWAPADGSAFAGLNQRRTRLIRSNIFPANTVQQQTIAERHSFPRWRKINPDAIATVSGSIRPTGG
jgi:hypothetical protein